MSDTLGNLTRNVREMVGDVGARNPAFRTERIQRSIEAYCQFLSNDLYSGQAWVTGALNLVSGTADYTMPAAEYAQISLLRLASQNWLIERVTTEAMEQYRLGPTQTPGDPYLYATIESTAQVVTIELWPRPNKTDTVDALRSVLVGSLANDAAVIPFVAPVCRAIEFRVASDLVASATQEQAAQLQVSPSVVPIWTQVAERAIVKEKERQHALKAINSIMRRDRGGIVN